MTNTGINYHFKTTTMIMHHSIKIIQQRGEVAKKKLNSFITDEIIDQATQELINKLLTLLIIEDVRQN